MLENLTPETVIAATTGTAAGATSVGWLLKILVTRTIKANDEKHTMAANAITKLGEAQTKAYNQLMRELRAMRTDVEVIKARIGECMSLRDAVTENTKDIAVSLERIKNNGEDIDQGFAGVRTRISEVLKTMNQLKGD